jgi:hypothetical protein
VAAVIAPQQIRLPAPGRSAGRRSRPQSPRRALPRANGRVSAATYRRRRTVALGLLAFLALGAWMAIHAMVAGPGTTLPAGTRTIAQRVWVVRPGDTLWSIALASGARGDIRPEVDALSSEVHGQALQVGERIVLP